MGKAQRKRAGEQAITARWWPSRLPCWGWCRPALLCALLFIAGSGTAWPQSPAMQSPAKLTPADLEAGFTQLANLGAFFGAFAERETNDFAQDRWRRLSVNYRGTAAILRGLLADGDLIIDDLPPGRRSALLDNGRIVIDDDLDGRWPADAEGEPAALRDYLLPSLMQGLARRTLSQDWPWLADHLRAIGGFGALAQDPLARPLLARFFQAKDAYLWLAMQRIAQGDPARRQALARRQAALFEVVRALRVDLAATFGAEPAERLQADWAAYVAQVDGFSATRGWLLLDPALRLTQLGAEAEADAVDLAAAEVIAEAPRSALAAARAGSARPAEAAGPTARPPATSPPRVSLGEIVAQAGGQEGDTEAPAPEAASPGPELSEVVAEREAELAAARDALTALQARVGELDRALQDRTAETAELEGTLAAERGRLAAAERQAAEQAATAEALAAEVRQLADLKEQLAELEATLSAKTGEAERLEALLREERTRLAEAERQRAAAAEALMQEKQAREAAAREAEQAAAAARQAAAEAEAARQAEAEAQARAQAAQEAAQASAPAPEASTPSAAEELAPVLSRIEQRQLYMMVAIGAIVLLALLLWLRSRRRVVVVDEPAAPLLLTAAVSAGQAGAAMPARPVPERPAPERPVIEVPEETPQAEAPETEAAASERLEGLPRVQPGAAAGRIKVSGVAPLTLDAKAAVKAGVAKARAAEASAPPPSTAESKLAGQVAELGRESDAAAHPAVRALRKGNLPLFELLFSEMTGLHSPQLQRVVYGGQGEDLAIVCRAVGVDKLLFGSLLLLTDPLRGGDADEDPARAEEILRMYDRMPPATAKKVLAKWQRNWGEDLVMEEEESTLG